MVDLDMPYGSLTGPPMPQSVVRNSRIRPEMVFYLYYNGSGNGRMFSHPEGQRRTDSWSDTREDRAMDK